MLLKRAYLLVLALASFNANAISTTTNAKVSGNVALERIQAYAASSTQSKPIGIVEPGTELIEHKSLLKTRPGLAMMMEPPKGRAIPFDRGAHVYIWEYLENGFSKVVVNNVTYTAKIARSKEECNIFPASPKYCWARVIEEPEYYEWKQVSLTNDGQRFWILNRLIDGSGIISVKDEAIVKTRLIKTTHKEQTVTEPTEAKQTSEVEIIETEKKDNKELFSADVLEEATLPKDPFARKMVESMLKPKSEIAKELKEKKQKEEKKKAPIKEIPQEEIFKQQNLTGMESLNANLKGNSTKDTIKKVNEDLGGPATKLNLKANQPLTLPSE
ncbi:MAG TPA: hypothetical protein DCL21_00730 [Alphaproteobacteria bacterium]|nr:hypothetical protein [Alphaproteobacteria bacterium]